MNPSNIVAEKMERSEIASLTPTYVTDTILSIRHPN